MLQFWDMEHTERYKEILSGELAVITADLKDLGVHNPENPEDWTATPIGTETPEADENVSADHAEELEERTATLADLELRYNATLRALKKIETDTFGICEICQKGIEAARLDANPAARTCIEHREEESGLSIGK